MRKGLAIPTPAGRLWSKIRGNLKEICRAGGLLSVQSVYQGNLISCAYAVEELAAKDDVLFLGAQQKAGRLFDEDHVTVAELLYYRLASRFSHYLIDEFQDTSCLQWHNLEKDGGEALSTGGSLFTWVTADRPFTDFLGGEVGLFDDVASRFDAFPVKVEYLTRNWRSRKAIVDFNSTIFFTRRI